MSLAVNIQRIQQAKADIKSAIADKGVVVGDEKIDELASLIEQIEGGGDVEAYNPYPLPTTAVTLTMKSGTLNVAVNDHIKILDKNFKSWTIAEWHAKAVENGFDKSLRAEPIGFDMEAWGKHFYWYFKTKYRDESSAKTYYDVSGTTAYTGGQLRHSQWQHPLITGVYSKTDLNGTTATATLSEDKKTLTLSTTNSPKTWTMPVGCGATNALITDNMENRFNSLVAQTEWFRHRAAIDSGLTTTEADGTEGVVTIVTEDDGEMYFYVNGTKTSCLAKYNIHSMLNVENPTQTIIDAIYEAQKTNGTNMNASCENGDAKPVLTEGSKGAEAYAFNGKWMIVTPILSRANANLTIDYNIPDAPAVYYDLWLREQLGRDDIIMPNERILQAYWTNRSYAINSYISYLNNANGECWGTTIVPTSIDTNSWSVVRYGANLAWCVDVGNGSMGYSNVNNRYVGVGVSALS